jgi:hypothetical protein
MEGSRRHRIGPAVAWRLNFGSFSRASSARTTFASAGIEDILVWRGN